MNPGFKIKMYVRDENGTEVTIREAKNETQIWTVVKNTPKQQNALIIKELLQRMIRVAATKRALNRSNDDIIKEAIEKKADLLRPDFLTV